MYNGWKNRQTWNVALWLDNEETLCRAAQDFMKHYKGKSPYKAFVREYGLNGDYTPDGIKWDGIRLDYGALNEFMQDLREG